MKTNTDIHRQRQQFQSFLNQQAEYFSSVEEQEAYQDDLYGIADHLDGIINLIFGNDSDLTERQHIEYRMILLKSLRCGLDEKDGHESPNEQLTTTEANVSKFDAVLQKFIDKSQE